MVFLSSDEEPQQSQLYLCTDTHTHTDPQSLLGPCQVFAVVTVVWAVLSSTTGFFKKAEEVLNSFV